MVFKIMFSVSPKVVEGTIGAEIVLRNDVLKQLIGALGAAEDELGYDFPAARWRSPGWTPGDRQGDRGSRALTLTVAPRRGASASARWVLSHGGPP